MMMTDAGGAMGDEELAERARAGDSRAFGELWKRHARAGLAAARQFSSIADPDDIVAEAYLLILRAVQRGGGPREAFRPYLYRTIRNVALGWIDRSGTVPLDDAPEPAVAGDLEDDVLESTITVKAFRTLPERWQTVLWYTEVEGMDAAQAAPYLGLTPNGAAALAYRAREGLKKAWLQAHVNDLRVPEECRWTTERMADYSRGTLSPTARARFEEHLSSCARCSILVEEIDDISGRLAAILLPVVLGGGAGAALLAELIGHGAGSGAAAPAGPRSLIVGGPRQLTAVVGGVVLAAAAAAGIAFAIGAQPVPVAPHTVAAAPESSVPPSTRPTPPVSAPSPTSDTTPPAEQPPAAPRTPQVRRAVAPAVVTTPSPPPPTTPVISSPATGALLATSTPTITGTGEPGTRVELALVAPGATPVSIGDATVAPDGVWTVTTIRIPDGVDTLQAVLVDGAGRRSPSTALTLTIDTVALPPTIDALPIGPLEYLPTLAGTAEAGATVTVSDGAGPIGTALAGSDGVWTFRVPDPSAASTALTATQTDVAGNTSVATAPLTIAFDLPQIIAPANGATIASTAGGTVVEVDIAGIAGQQVEISIDGVFTGNIHTLQSTPIARVTPPLVDGSHRIGVRYIDPATGDVGATTEVAFLIR